ncbi:MAG: hypothetical protein ACREV5_17500 [Steroidobacter sp.]
MATASDEQDRRRGVRRTAWRLLLLALAVYFGFIALSVVRGS